MIAFTAEVIARERHFMGGITLDAEAFALDLIDRLGPGGQYLTEEHTLRHFRELWNPTLFSRERKDIWVRKGQKRLGDRLRRRPLR